MVMDFTQGNTPQEESEFNFEKVEEIAVLDRNNKGWTTELNKVSYNGKPAKFDLRTWSPTGRPGKGMVLADVVAERLFMAMADYFETKAEAEQAPSQIQDYPEPPEAHMGG